MTSYSPPTGYEQFTALRLERTEGILTITISNPAKKNAVTPQMSEELATIWEAVWTDAETRVVILTGDGDNFCSGADLSGIAARHGSAPPERLTHPTTRVAKKHVYGIMECEKPVLAKVRGVAYGLGVNMALASDMVFASDNARLCDSHVKAGMVAGDGGVLLWPLAIGFHRAKQYLMTGEPVPAKLAAEIGLINACVPDAELDAHVQAMAEKLRDLPPHAINYTKMSLNLALKQMTQTAFEASLAYEIYSMGMNDFKEATTAFVEKRKGVFKGN
ncbi:enoyl-CoA hydratase/isomerase family protein [Sphingopyxis fribergensis]